MKKNLCCLFLVLFCVNAMGQQTQEIKGKIVDSKSLKPLRDVVAHIQSSNQSELTNENGEFYFENISIGSQTLILSYTGFISKRLVLDVIADQPIDLGVITLDEDFTSENQINLITITDDDLGDDNSGSETTSGLLQSSKDAFQQSAAFNWGQVRFKIRGLDNEYGRTLINGVVMNKIYDGRPQWSNWGGLNDATRVQEFSMGTEPSDYLFGGILGTQAINTRASRIRKGGRISFSGSNTNYSYRPMFTYSSGMNKDGWAYVLSTSYRGAKEGHFEGTNYRAGSIFLSVEKRFNDEHSLNFTQIYAKNQRGANSNITDEVADLKGHKYNSYWGWQGKHKRNSRYKNIEEPIFMLSHYWTIDDKNSLTTTASYQFGKIGASRLNYKNIYNPDPVYYRNLPSYALNIYDANGNPTPNEELAELKKEEFLNDGQINWLELYSANLNNKNNESKVFLYEDIKEDKTLSFNTNFKSLLTNHVTLDAGLNFRKLISSNYKYSVDLLGGKGFVDIDHYQQGDAQQTNLDNRDRFVKKFEKFGYNYNLFADVADLFTQFKFDYDRFNFYVGQNISYTSYQREGLYKNGIYPEDSKGKSGVQEFSNFGLKGGLIFHISGRHALSLNAAYMNQAPNLKITFANARLNNKVIQDLNNEVVFSVDGSYIVRTPKFKARVTGYLSEITDASNITFYYSEMDFVDAEGNLLGGNGNGFVSEILTGINKRNIGTELGLEYLLTQTIKVNAAAAIGQSFYTNNPNLKLNSDNAGITNDYGEAYLKNYRIASGPQTALSLGLEYRDPKFWWVGVNANYLAENYVSVSPLTRTENFVQDFENGNLPFEGITESKLRSILKQEKLKDFTLINITGGKSWMLPNRTTIGFFASINNVFNITYKTGGFEQARISKYPDVEKDIKRNPRTYGNRYYYGYGRNFFVNLYYNF